MILSALADYYYDRSSRGTDSNMPLSGFSRQKIHFALALDAAGRLAPCAGAWIETWSGAPARSANSVAPCAGAWIETLTVPSATIPARKHQGVRAIGQHPERRRV